MSPEQEKALELLSQIKRMIESDQAELEKNEFNKGEYFTTYNMGFALAAGDWCRLTLSLPREKKHA